MPVVLRLNGYRFGFYASDKDEPPHVHVEKGGASAKYWLAPMRLDRNHGFRPHELNEIERMISDHLQELLELGMHSSVLDLELDVRATAVRVTDDSISVDLEDGRTISVPTAWHPRLANATVEERAHVNILPDAIEWPDVEADTSIKGLLLGHKSGESPESLQFWLDHRKQGKRVTVMDWLAARKQEKTKREQQ